jgi:hypothetical protein
VTINSRASRRHGRGIWIFLVANFVAAVAAAYKFRFVNPEETPTT